MTTSTTKLPVWDGFIRGYHWLQALSVLGLWYTGTEGLMDWHFSIAYFLMALLLTRLIWGVFGSDTAQFEQFVRSPRTVFAYFRHPNATTQHGHNPAGAYMVLFFMLLLLSQLVTGLFANDDIISEGPLAYLVSSATSSEMTQLHALNFDVLLGAIGLHVAAVFIYLLKKDNLITPMIHGKKPSQGLPAPQLRNGIIGWVIFLVIGSVIYSYWAKDVVMYLF